MTIGMELLLDALQACAKNCDCEDCRQSRSEATSPRTPDVQARVLLDSYAKLSETFEKKSGLLLTPKKGIYHGYNLREDAVLIITRIFEIPIQSDSKERGSNHYGRVMDIAVLVDNPEHGPVEYVVDSRFFEPYEGLVA